jgi:hypothetical protein
LGAKESKEMSKARLLVLAGATAYKAAKLAKITHQAIYVAPWYKKLKQEKQK